MSNAIRWLTLVILSIIFIYTPYLRGLFFDTDFYVVESIIALVFTVFIGWFFFKNAIIKHNLVYLIIFLIPVTHLLSLFTAESPKGGLDNLFRWSTYSAFFVLLIWVKNYDSRRIVNKVLTNVFHATGAWVSLHAVFGVWGWLQFRDLLLDGRLSGVFQYANTFAAFICSFWLFSLLLLIKRKLPIWQIVFLSAPLVAYGFGLLFSYSRGVMLIFPIVWFFCLVILKTKEQISFLFYSLLSVIGSFLYFQHVTTSIEQNTATVSETFFFILSAALVLFVLLFHLFIKNKVENSTLKLFEKRYSRFVLPVTVVIVGLLLVTDLKYQGLVYQQVPESIQKRISDINFETVSVVGRTTFYKDALKISRDAPIFGIGGEGWGIAYTRYQETPYLSNEVHNGYLEILISNGLLGLLVFILVFVYLVIGIFRDYKQINDDGRRIEVIAAMAGVAMVLLHGAIDFDFSFGTMWLLIFWLIAIAIPNQRADDQKGEVIYSDRLKKIVLLAISLLVILSGFFSARFWWAEETMKENKQQSAHDLQRLMEKAISLNPYDIDYRIRLAKLYANQLNSEQKVEWKNRIDSQVKSILELEPNNPRALRSIASVYLELNDWQQSIVFFEQAQKVDRFSPDNLNALIQIRGQVAEQSIYGKEVAQAKLFAQAVLTHYHEYQKMIEPFKRQKLPDKRPLELKESAYLYVAKSQIILGDFDSAIKTLGRVKNKDILLEVKALTVVAYEALNQSKEASKIVKSLIPQYPDFPQRVVAQRALLN
ncbi:O-antigen ligase family protein [Brevibacillus panacihumi]|uniref:O-antigen ligase family protein n=1 Tax=Brevibacillus panacihumi TaxID=497735 RepID=UPI003CFDFFAC